MDLSFARIKMNVEESESKQERTFIQQSLSLHDRDDDVDECGGSTSWCNDEESSGAAFVDAPRADHKGGWIESRY